MSVILLSIEDLRLMAPRPSCGSMMTQSAMPEIADSKIESLDPPSPIASVGDLVRVEVGEQVIIEKTVIRAIQEYDNRTWVFVAPIVLC